LKRFEISQIVSLPSLILCILPFECPPSFNQIVFFHICILPSECPPSFLKLFYKKFLEIGNQLATNLITASNNLSKAVTGSVERESRLKVNDELSKIIGLSSKDRLKAARLIVCQPEIIDLFFSVPDHDMEELVRGIINDA
jgi:hypothetical protein